ncbi:type II toxin-antitoxin system mRNA interferase toxin, RelE/StbE family [Candidatus Gottesmanbacteria bacterium]|nr:type II toxin-antitoxin system mRNA interferase toxin, RelE/StbE family [Candidatus Gottesmanbacteria bacterium]
MIIHESSTYSRKLEKLVRRDVNLREKIDRKLQVLIADRNYPSLRLHKIEVVGDAVWSISIDLKIRILFSYVKDGVLLFNIGDHDEVY